LIWIETDGRLVENEKIGFVQKRVRQTDPLAITFGESTDQLLLHFPKAAKFLCIAHALGEAAVRDPFQRRAIIKVFSHAHVGVERHIFRHVAQMGPRLKRLLKNIEPGNVGSARRRRHEAGQNAHGGRFACPVWSQKSHDFALADFEIKILNRRVAGVTFR
jgi:hypothetical protein